MHTWTKNKIVFRPPLSELCLYPLFPILFQQLLMYEDEVVLTCSWLRSA